MDARFPPLIQALLQRARYGHAVEDIHVAETHISWVILTGPFAYKIKKPVNLGFLDFSTLELRRHFCAEELRLNRRQAPELYLGLVPITGRQDDPVLNGRGETIEYAVKMRQFPQEAQLDRVLARGELRPEHMDLLAGELADFHGKIAVAGPGSPYGEPESIQRPVRENFRQIRARAPAGDMAQLQHLETWSEQCFADLTDEFVNRKRDGFVRECHGDLHLANMTMLEKKIVFFDCLEFNDNLRWIDVMSEVAFLVMDLDDRRRPDLARRCLNVYLEITGDYGGLRLLRFYQVYRALVRAKVASIRLGQQGLDENEQSEARELYRGYAAQAQRYMEPNPAPLIITHGLSGSGKTTFAQFLLQVYGGIRVRSDAERKRLHGLAAQARSGSPIAAGLYSEAATRMTYARLEELARMLLRAGFSVIVDAAFLKRAQRDRFRALAEEERAPFVILNIEAPETVLRERLRTRKQKMRDASEADADVLQYQLAMREALGENERRHALDIDSERSPGEDALKTALARLTG